MNDNKIDNLFEEVKTSKVVKKSLIYISFIAIFQLMVMSIIFYFIYKVIFVDNPIINKNDTKATFKAMNNQILPSSTVHKFLGGGRERIVKYIGTTNAGKYVATNCFTNLLLSDNVGFTYYKGKNILFITDDLIYDKFLCKITNKRELKKLDFDKDNLNESYLNKEYKYVDFRPINYKTNMTQHQEIINHKDNIVLKDGTILIPLAIINIQRNLKSKKEAINFIEYNYHYTKQADLFTAGILTLKNYYWHNLLNAKTSDMEIDNLFSKELSTRVSVGDTSRVRLDPYNYTYGLRIYNPHYPSWVDMTNKVW